MRFIGDVSAQDIKRINKALRLVEPELLKEIRTKIRSIAKPIETQIKKNIPTSPPMSGMGGVVFNKKTGNYSINEGRLRWDGAGLRASRSVKPNATSITSAIKASGRSLTTSLAKIVVRSPAVSMADMAGRANKSRSISREYVYRNRAGELVKRRHRVTTQGKKFIENLAGKASRYGWPALEAKIDDVARQLETEVLDNYYRKLNRRF
jgi:hypothetical protein